MKVAYFLTKPASPISGSEIRNFNFIDAMVNSKSITEIRLIYSPMGMNETATSIQNKKISILRIRPRKRNAKDSIYAYLIGKIPYVEHLKNLDFSEEQVRWISSCDIVVMSELDGYFFASNFLEKINGNPRLILDAHNVDYLRLHAEIGLSGYFKKLLARRFWKILRRLEIAATQEADLVIACSKNDEAVFQNLNHEVNSVVIPNGVSIPNSRTLMHIEQNSVVFIGLLSYSPNEDAIKYYVKKVHPLVKAKAPDATLTVIGKNPPKWLVDCSKNDPSVRVLGFVENAQSIISSASVCICPVRQGSGTRLKLLEYMSAGKAVVTTTAGCEGVEVSHKEHVLIADTELEFAKSVLYLLRNEKERNRMGKNASGLVRKKYDWDKLRKLFISTVLAEAKQ
jgi:glycosyltransferase involved in cell wall biosynthesis